jgi:phosphate butyryltransferase
MTPIRSLEQLVTQLQGQPSRRVAVAAGHDPNTIQACARAAAEDIAEVILVGDEARIADLCTEYGLDPGIFTVIAAADEAAAGAEAVRLVRAGEADVLMKGLIGTDKYMRLILDKERGLLPPKAVLSHVTVLDIPAYRASQDKLLIVSDVAIIPDPDLATKLKIVQYVIDAAHAFGIAEPKVALIAATEKVNPKMQACVDAALITQMNRRGQITGAIVDGPWPWTWPAARKPARSRGSSRRSTAARTAWCSRTSRPATSSTRRPRCWAAPGWPPPWWERRRPAC